MANLDQVSAHSPAVIVRRAQLSDAETLVQFNLQLAEETEQKLLDRDTVTSGVQRLIANPSAGFYVVAEQGPWEDQVAQIVASLLITFEWSDWRNGWFWWIQSVYVRPKYRRRGIYRQLHQHARSMAALDVDVRGLRLYVEQDNMTAQATYQSLGMHATRYQLFEECW